MDSRPVRLNGRAMLGNGSVTTVGTCRMIDREGYGRLDARSTYL